MTDANEKKTLKLNFETVGSLSAIVLGASALFVAWDQAQVMRAQQHASVWPVITADFSLDEAEQAIFVEMTVSNKGVGPAQIESAELTVDDEPVTRWKDFEARLFEDQKPEGQMGFGGSDMETAVIGAGDEISLFKAVWQKSDVNEAAFRALAIRYVTGKGPTVELTTCYCSVFDRCFLSSGKERPQRVKQCPAPTGFFSNFFVIDQAAEQ